MNTKLSNTSQSAMLLEEGLDIDAASNGTNPTPIILEDTEILVNDFLSYGRLQEITGHGDLENVTMVEMIVNTTETTMGAFGSYLPKLKHLKLSNSVIPSVRDIGTSLSHLSVLWMSCCGLRDVDGIASMISLTELYLAYNDIEDISPLSFLDNIEVLDMEGNQITDKEQFDYLAMLMKLRTLSVSGNPVCQILNKEALRILEDNSFQSSIDTMSYREVIIKKLPQLQYLDDEKCETYAGTHSPSSSERPSTASLAASSHSQEDIDLINTAIKEGLISEEETSIFAPVENNFSRPGLDGNNTRPGSARLRRPGSALNRPMTASPLGRSLHSPSTRPQTAFSGGRSESAGALRAEAILQKASNAQRPTSSGSGDVNLQDESSTLTFGDVMCGNPIKALRARKTSPMPVLSILQNDNSTRPLPTRPATAATFRSRPSVDQFPDEQMGDIFSELREWRAKHEERMTAIKSDVQVLKLDNATSSDDISIDSDGTESDTDEILDLDSIPGLNDDNNNSETKFKPENSFPNTSFSTFGQNQRQLRSPPPKNLSPSSMGSTLSPKSSPRSPRSPLFSSAQFDSASVPVLRGSPKPRSPVSPNQFNPRHVPAPPKVGAPRPRTAADFRLRRSLGASHDPFVPLTSPMTLPQALSPNKNQKRGKVNQ
uniref:leucine-rich repeat-containing protein 56-like n=1 Tax=Styela clava TaxID=7725 RepID=UPI00193A6413|nr:leucine-rich repeat-containing protein 56-like [Styela clava]